MLEMLVYEESVVFGDGLRYFTASWYLKPLENMFVSWPED